MSLTGKQPDKLHKLTLFRFLTDFMVDIFVGAERTKFHLHRDLLCNRSDYFRACFVGDFKEAQQKELFLPEDNIRSFELFVTWLYGTHLKKISSNDELPAYVGLAVLADKICLEYLHNQTTDNVLRFYRTNPGSVDHQYLRYIYQNTSNSEKSSAVPVAFAAWKVFASQKAELTGGYRDLIREGGDLAVDFMDNLLLYYPVSQLDPEEIEDLDPRRLSNCSLHKHRSTPTCINQPKEGPFSRPVQRGW